MDLALCCRVGQGSSPAELSRTGSSGPTRASDSKTERAEQLWANKGAPHNSRQKGRPHKPRAGNKLSPAAVHGDLLDAHTHRLRT